MATLVVVLPGFVVSQDAPPPSIRVDTVATGLSVPRRLVFLSSNEALVASDRFRLSLLDVSTGRHSPIPGGPAPIRVRNGVAETGIFDLLLHPDFARNRMLYICVAIGTTARTSLAVMRARLDRNRLVDTATLLVVAAWDTSEAHYGGRLAHRDGYLYVSVGERQARAEVQSLASHKGKILRIHDDGRVPADNPFVGLPAARPEIWTLGHRNPQGLAFDSAGTLWSNEHGPRHGDEMNRIERGRDYGWPRVSFGHEYEGGAVGSGFTTDSLATLPLWVWTPAISPSDLMVYSGRAFAAWRGNLFSTSLNASRRHLGRLVWSGQRFVMEERLFPDQLGRLRSITEGPEGWLYVGNDGGQIVRLRPGERR